MDLGECPTGSIRDIEPAPVGVKCRRRFLGSCSLETRAAGQGSARGFEFFL